ncbi:unnamed protein product [Prunus armeniaca]
MIISTILKKNNGWHNHIVFNGNPTISKENNSQRNSVVFFEGNRSMRTSSSTPLKIKSKNDKVRKNCIDVSVKKENGMLKSSNKPPHILVFERLGNKASNCPTRISVFERLIGIATSQKLQKSKKWRVKKSVMKSSGQSRDVEATQVNYVSIANDNPTENEEHEIWTPDNEPVEFIDNV